MNHERLINSLNKLAGSIAKKVPTLQVGFIIPSLNLNYKYLKDNKTKTFHAASVTKLFTSVLIFILIEKNLISLDSKINTILDKKTLKDLFVFKNVDYQDAVTIRHLLNNTSGVNDYLQGKSSNKLTLLKEVVKNPNKFYTPEDLLNFTRVFQKAVGVPGAKFLYSNTGYVLLGLIIEKITNLSFASALDKFILEQLNLNDTGLSFYSKSFDQSKLAPVYINKVDISKYKSLSCHFSGGGIYSTSDDLVKFLKALQDHQLISESSLNQLEKFENSMNRLFFYGLGMMEARFKSFLFLLSKIPTLQGHLGISGVHAWYNKSSKDIYVFNVGSNLSLIRSFQFLIISIYLIEKEKKQLVK